MSDTATISKTDEVVKLQPNYAVILHDDDAHTINFVIETLGKVFRYGIDKCTILAWQVHYEGRSIVWIGPLETAEFKRDLLTNCGEDPYNKTNAPLNVTIEPMV